MNITPLFIEWARPIVEAHDVPAGSSSKCYCEICSHWDKIHKEEV